GGGCFLSLGRVRALLSAPSPPVLRGRGQGEGGQHATQFLPPRPRPLSPGSTGGEGANTLVHYEAQTGNSLPFFSSASYSFRKNRSVLSTGLGADWPRPHRLVCLTMPHRASSRARSS